jgi:hypothetical protein
LLWWAIAASSGAAHQLNFNAGLSVAMTGDLAGFKQQTGTFPLPTSATFAAPSVNSIPFGGFSGSVVF